MARFDGIFAGRSPPVLLEIQMTRAPLALLGAALLLTACGKDNGHGSAAAADSTAAATQPLPATTETPAPTTGPTRFAREGVDSSNAAQQQRLNEINDLSDQASGTAKP